MFSNNAGQIKKDEDVINGAILSIEHSFGFPNIPIMKNAHFISDDTILYPTGRHLATLDLVSRKMDFIKREESYASNITSLAVGMSRKKEWVIALGENQSNGIPRALIYIPLRLRWFKLEHD